MILLAGITVVLLVFCIGLALCEAAGWAIPAEDE